MDSPRIPVEVKVTHVYFVGTLFLERWKRANARLAYQWDVDNFEEQVILLYISVGVVN